MLIELNIFNFRRYILCQIKEKARVDPVKIVVKRKIKILRKNKLKVNFKLSINLIMYIFKLK